MYSVEQNKGIVVPYVEADSYLYCNFSVRSGVVDLPRNAFEHFTEGTRAEEFGERYLFSADVW